MLLGLGGWSLRRMAIAQEQSAATAREAIHRLAEAKAAAEDRQHAEAAARREAAEANRAKSEFLAMMSHELRTPLNAILGFSEVIAGQTLGKEASDRYSDYAQNIHDSGQHLLALINDILDLSRIEAGRVDLDPVPIDLGEIIETVTTLVSRRRGRAAIPIRREILAPVVVLDERAAKQILVNLVGNAVKFTEAGEVGIAARWRDGWLQIVVADTGPGMDVEEVRRAREPFCQVDMSLARRHEGTGLGLPITERLVALLGGTMEIDSTPGVGTTVTVRLPAAAYTGAPAAIAPAPSPASERVA
jgi:signal transduction histidine kinase